MQIGALVNSPLPLMAVELVNIALHLKGMFVSTLSAIALGEMSSIVRFDDAKSGSTAGLRYL